MLAFSVKDPNLQQNIESNNKFEGGLAVLWPTTTETPRALQHWIGQPHWQKNTNVRLLWEHKIENKKVAISKYTVYDKLIQ